MWPIGILITGWVIGFWALYCNQKTSSQRKQLIDLVFSQPDWKSAVRHFDSVSYGEHMLSLATFRDPMRLYPAPLQEIAK